MYCINSGTCVRENVKIAHTTKRTNEHDIERQRTKQKSAKRYKKKTSKSYALLLCAFIYYLFLSLLSRLSVLWSVCVWVTHSAVRSNQWIKVREFKSIEISLIDYLINIIEETNKYMYMIYENKQWTKKQNKKKN